MAVLGGWALSYERGTSEAKTAHFGFDSSGYSFDMTLHPSSQQLRFPRVVPVYPLGNGGRPGSPGCHEESEARMVKVNLLSLSAPPRRLE